MCRKDEQTGEIVDLLRPDLDEEEIETPGWKVDQHRLIRCALGPRSQRTKGRK